VLVHLDDSHHSDARADFAPDFALRHNAHLIGLYLVRNDWPGVPVMRQGDTQPRARSPTPTIRASARKIAPARAQSRGQCPTR
jgi:hypothetical protein